MQLKPPSCQPACPHCTTLMHVACALNLNRGGFQLKASQPWVFIGRTVQPHNVQSKPISCQSNSEQHLEKNKRSETQQAPDNLVSKSFCKPPAPFWKQSDTTVHQFSQKGDKGSLNIDQTKTTQLTDRFSALKRTILNLQADSRL